MRKMIIACLPVLFALCVASCNRPKDAEMQSAEESVTDTIVEEEEDESGMIFKVGSIRCDHIYLSMEYDVAAEDDEAEIKFKYKIMDYDWAMGKGRGTGLKIEGTGRLDSDDSYPKNVNASLGWSVREVPLKTFQDMRVNTPDGFGGASYDPYNYGYIRSSDKLAARYKVSARPFVFSMSKSGKFTFRTRDDLQLAIGSSGEMQPVKVNLEGRMILDIDEDDDDEFEAEGEVILVFKKQENGEWSTRRIK